MNTNHPIYKESLRSLQEQAVEDINIIRDGLVSWADMIRPAEGPGGRFNWAVKYNPDVPANVASTGYATWAFARAGILDDVLSEEDKKEGIEWIRSMKQAGGMFFDPAFDRDPEDPGDLDGFKEAVNRYAEGLLAEYGEKAAEIEMSPPPENWPQVETAHTGANWIKMRTWEYDTWKAGATSEKVVYFLYQWYLKGLIGIEPLADALREVYSLQDPKTGLWSTRSKSNCTLQNRINGSFKLMMVLAKDLSLPLPHGEKMVDTLIEHMTSDYYRGSRSGCDELDNILVLTVGSLNCGDYRFDEVQKLAAYSISLIREQYQCEDGGLSFYPDYCQHNWLGHAVAPIILQGDAMGAGVHTLGISVAVDIAGLKDKVKWVVNWRDDWRSSRGEDAERKLKALKENLSDVLLCDVVMK